MSGVLTLTQLLSSHDVVVQQEVEDREKVIILGSITLTSPEFATMKTSLLQWASRGCPEVFPVYSISFNAPETCADGAVRSFIDYVQYLLPRPLVTYVSAVNALLPGMQLTYSYTETTLTINVSKDPSWTA
jgi:hypothetical protein